MSDPFEGVVPYYARALLENVADEMKRGAETDPNRVTIARMVLSLNAYLLRRFPHCYEPERVMRGPTMRLADGTPMEAKTRAYSTVLVYEIQKNGPHMVASNPVLDDAEDPEEELCRVVAGEIALELAFERASLARRDMVMYPYVPITANGIIMNPVTVKAEVRFLSRYGIGKA